MPHHIPLDIQEDIIKRLPIKLVIEFRLVSKLWKSLIDSSRFTNEYHLRQTNPGYVLIKSVYVFGRALRLPMNPSILRSSRGLIYHLEYKTNNDYKASNAILWDPLIRKCVAINLHVPLGSSNDTIVKTIIGFGVCRQTKDPKLVKITPSLYTVPGTKSWQVEVFSSTSGTWEEQPVTGDLLDIDEFSYWLALDGKTLQGEFQWYDLVMSIDMKREEFNQVDSLTTQGVDLDLFISKFRKPLVALETNVVAGKQVYGLRMKMKRVPKSFLNLFQINTREASITKVYGFRTSGGKINEHCALIFYKRYSNDIQYYIMIDGKRYSFFVFHGTDQLLLHDR